MKFSLCATAVFAALLGAGAAQAAQAPAIVTSIKPLHSLVAAIMQGVGTPDLIVDGAASPHTYAMKPSNARVLQRAKLVFWMGPGLEAFLEKPLSSLSTDTTVIRLDQAPNLVKLPFREGGAFEAHADEDEKHDARLPDGEVHAETADHAHSHDEAQRDTHEDGHGQFDTHLWLDPLNAKAIATEITTSLVAADPQNALIYEANAKALNDRIDALDAQIRATVEPVKTKPFIVFHDAYQYFEHRYGVHVAGSITVSPETLPGAERLSEIHSKVASLGATCVFAEPQFQPRLIDVTIEGTKAKASVLDPEGTTLKAGPELYFTLMQGIADNLRTCLTSGS